MRIAVFGAGHAGVPTAGALARFGHEVAVNDADARKIDVLSGGSVPFYEPGLEDLVREGLEAGRLAFMSDPAGALRQAEAVFVCVGTPPLPDGRADVGAVEEVVKLVARHAPGTIVAIRSTVPVGTTDRVAASLPRAEPPARHRVASNPEFLREGRAVEDSLRPVRVLVGARDPEVFATLQSAYAPLIRTGVPWIETDPPSAEVAKHACNAFLAMKVSYVNALAEVCRAAGADVETVTRTMGADERIGPAYLGAGLGYGGYCLPKDVRAFERAAAALGYEFGLLREVERINAGAVEAGLNRVLKALGELPGKRVALLGLAFKPGTDNVTSAPALALARRLLAGGAEVAGYDPQGGAGAKAEVPDMDVAGDPYAALEGAHCAVLCTEWEELVALDPARMHEVMATPVIVDGRNALDGEALVDAGFTYLPTGRPPRTPSDR